MSRHRVLAAWALGTLMVLGFTASAQAAEKPDGVTTVAGIITDPADGEPAANAPVKVVTSSNLQSIPKKSGNGVLWCEELFPNQVVTGVSDSKGVYSVELKAYKGSEECDFLVVGNAQLPSGEVAKGAVSIQGLTPNATVTLTLPGQSAQANVKRPSSASASSDDRVFNSSETESGYPRWLDSAGPWLLRGGVLLAAVAIVGFFLWLTVLVARAAQRKGRSYWPWFWIAFFFLIPAAIIVAIMKNDSNVEIKSAPNVSPPPPTSDVSTVAGANAGDRETKTCPFCGESILAVAKKCKHCGEFLDQ